MGTEHVKKKFNTLFAELKTERDEINLQAHLAASELKDELRDLERQWEDFRRRAAKAGDDVQETADDVGEDLHLLGQDIKRGYQRIRRHLSS